MHEVPSDTMGSLEDAARFAGVSTRTLVKWWEAGEFNEGEWVRLKAKRGRGQAYAISLVAARRVAAEHWTPPRVRATPPSLPISPPIPAPTASASPVARAAVVTRDLRPPNIPPLPEDWESVNAVVLRHGMRKNMRTMWRGRIESGALPAHHPNAKASELRGGPWWHDRQLVTYALDPEGVRTFGGLYRNRPEGRAEWWVDCAKPGCPACATPVQSVHGLDRQDARPYNEHVPE